MARSLTEQKVLKKLGIDDFRHLTKDKVITMASMLDRMDPEVAKKAIERKTGARGLRSIMEGILMETMYQVPQMESVARVVITADCVEGMKKPTLLAKDGTEIPYPESESKAINA